MNDELQAELNKIELQNKAFFKSVPPLRDNELHPSIEDFMVILPTGMVKYISINGVHLPESIIKQIDTAIRIVYPQ